MDARQCRRCGKLFQYVGNPICTKCIKELDVQFSEVRDYIYDHPGACIDEVVEETGVEESSIHRWLAEGRLILSHGSPIVLRCDQCGAAILTGRQCDACLAKLRNTLQDAANAMRPAASPPKKQKYGDKPKDKMHVDPRHVDKRKK
jgi:flagellar operon protein (TIGR03826 family)